MTCAHHCTAMLALAAISAPLLAGALPEPPVPQDELITAIANKEMEHQFFSAEIQQPEHRLSQFGELAPFTYDPAAPMPEKPEGHSAIVADGGLIFDNVRSSLSYLGNVRMNDRHAQLRAAYRLFIRLPKSQGEGNASTSDRPEKKPSLNERKTSLPATPAKKAPTKPANEEPEEPALIIAENAAVDLRDSKFLLEGRQQQDSLSITRATDSVTLAPIADDATARIYGAHQGDILFQGRNIVFIWHDSAGAEWKLQAATGPVYYHAARHCLAALGEVHVTSPQRTMSSQQALYIVFAPEETQRKPEPQKTTPFSQFAGLRFKDIEYLNAYGNVQLAQTEQEGAPAAKARAEALQYIAASGECRLYGDDCTLTYGNNTLRTDSAIELLGNGDAVIQGKSIAGAYERPFPTTPGGAQTIRGQYKAPGPITYNAQENRVLLPAGLTARDAHGSFTCTGRVELYFTAKQTAPKQPRSGIRMPNLAIANQSDIARLTAEGNIHAHSDASADQPSCDLVCNKLDARIDHGTATLTAHKKSTLRVSYGGYKLTAKAAATDEAEVRLLENGDIAAKGDTLHATMPGDKGATLMECRQELYLAREKNLLTLGKDSKITTPDAILTANAPLKAHLSPAPTPPSAPSKFPHLVYNFSGLHRATTPSGGTLRTTQASMQCEGPIEIELKENAQMSEAADARQNIRIATAEKRVQVAGKDATGRLLRAEGDRLDFDSATGEFRLHGRVVTLVDEFNIHTAEGRGARITIDPQNNVRVNGEHQFTKANKVRLQADQQKNRKK